MSSFKINALDSGWILKLILILEKYSRNGVLAQNGVGW